MKIDHTNIAGIDLSEYFHFKIKFTGASTRRGSNLKFEGKENCSGYNINKYVSNGMSVNEYQNLIKQHFNENDPQFSMTKHLIYDIKKGFIELHL
ncbi:hypothetical protein [Psychromonas sp. L1A2]|uniref:hypothetical protein n=1 Tax=Psychromonas sp. L1A2 TaxID=2686356 RepID=UPI0013576AB3|nr:hypothetical protein [Psychromonas sp. L1A2]